MPATAEPKHRLVHKDTGEELGRIAASTLRRGFPDFIGKRVGPEQHEPIRLALDPTGAPA